MKNRRGPSLRPEIWELDSLEKNLRGTPLAI